MATAKKAATPKSREVAVKSSNSLVSIKEALARDLAALAGKTAPAGGDSIQIGQDKTFKLPDGTKTSGPLQLVIVDFTSSNKFYDGPYDKDNIAPPACFAIGDNPTTLVPSDNSPVKQSDSCSTCPMNQFGSAGKGKACKNTRVLAVLPPDADEDTPLWILNVSPTAIKAFDSYVASVARQFQLPPVGVVTEVSFDENIDYASLRFGNPQPNEGLTAHFSRKEEATTRLAQEPDVSAYEAPKQIGRASAKPVQKARR